MNDELIRLRNFIEIATDELNEKTELIEDVREKLEKIRKDEKNLKNIVYDLMAKFLD